MDIDRRELKAVLTIWAVILGSAILCLVVLNLNSVRLINHIEYQKTSRWQRAQVLYDEAEKRLKIVMSRAEKLNRQTERQVPVPVSDRDYVKALELFGRAEALDPRDPFDPARRPVLEKMAALYGTAGREVDEVRMSAKAFIADRDYANAENYLNALLSRDKNDLGALGLLAETHLRAGNNDAAENDLDRLKSAGAPGDMVESLRARLLVGRGKIEEAAAAYEQVLKLAPASPEVRKRVSDLYGQLGRKEDSLRVLMGGLKLGGDLDPEYLNRLGGTLLEFDRNEEAARILEDAVKLERFSADLYWALAQAYQRLGKGAKADQALKEAFRLRPSLRQQVLNTHTR